MRKQPPLTLPDEARKNAVASIRRYFREELEQDIGDLKAGLVLEFFLAEIGASVYNAAIADAQAFFSERSADLGALCHRDEFAYWPPGTRRGQ